MEKITDKYKKLDEISHVLIRPGRYVGSIAAHEELAYTYVLDANSISLEDVTWTPALLKVFDEVISNSADFSKTEDGKHLNEIRVSVDRITGEISVYDNGGIPVVKHLYHDQWIPEMIFELRSGSNFDEENTDNDFSTGQNGEGAALTAIFSTSFRVDTSDGKNQFIQIHTNNSRVKSEPKVSKSKGKFTKITWMPDYEKFGLTGLDDDNYKILLKRTVDLAGCNPHVKVFFNEKLIKISKFEDYIRLYTDDFIFEQNDDWKVGIAHSDSGFKHISFVNSTATKIGGGHVDYITNQIVNKLREYFKKKHKVDVKPSDIKNHFILFIDAKIKKPRYDSQTKDNLITEIKNFGTSIELSDKFINKLLKTEIVQSVLDWVETKERANEAAELRKANKGIDKADPKKVEKFHDASTKNRSEAMLFLAEGDCLEENQEVIVHTEYGFLSKKIKDVNIKDKVITHTGSIKEVISKQHRLKPTMTVKTSIGDITCSKEHKFFVYDILSKEFVYIEAADLDKTRHKLVKGKFVDYDFVVNIDKINTLDESLYKLEFIFTIDGESNNIKTSLTHKFGCFDVIDEKFVFIEANEIIKNRHLLLFKNT